MNFYELAEYFGWAYDCDSFLVIFTGWVVIMIVSWAIENNLVYFRGNSGWAYDCDSFLGCLGNNLVIFEGNKGSAVVIYKIT